MRSKDLRTSKNKILKALLCLYRYLVCASALQPDRMCCTFSRESPHRRHFKYYYYYYYYYCYVRPRGSNPRPSALQASALPTELVLSRFYFIYLLVQGKQNHKAKRTKFKILALPVLYRFSRPPGSLDARTLFPSRIYFQAQGE